MSKADQAPPFRNPPPPESPLHAPESPPAPGLTPDLLAALDALPFAVRDFIVRSSADLARTVSRGGSSDGYYFGLCYGAILGVQVRRELPQDVVDALLRRVDQIYNPADSQE